MGFKHYDPTEDMSESEKRDYEASCRMSQMENAASRANAGIENKLTTLIRLATETNALIRELLKEKT